MTYNQGGTGGDLKALGWLIAAGLGLWWLARGKKSAPKAISSYALIGDSLGEGLAAPLAKELKPAKLSARAYVSATAKDWAIGKYKSELIEVLLLKPEVLLISLGTNDTVPPGGSSTLWWDLPENFKLIADLARKAGAVPIFIEPPPLPWSRQRIGESAALAGAKMIPTAGGLSHASDGIHLTSAGYEAWAKLVALALKS